MKDQARRGRTESRLAAVVLAVGVVVVLASWASPVTRAGPGDIGVASARVVDAEVTQRRSFSRSSSRGRRFECQYGLVYEVAGTRYLVRQSLDVSDMRTAESVCGQARRSVMMRVVYLRADPGIAFLDEERFGSLADVKVGLFLISMGVFVLLVNAPRRRPRD